MSHDHLQPGPGAGEFAHPDVGGEDEFGHALRLQLVGDVSQADARDLQVAEHPHLALELLVHPTGGAVADTQVQRGAERERGLHGDVADSALLPESGEGGAEDGAGSGLSASQRNSSA